MSRILLYGSLLLCSTVSYAQQSVGFKDGWMRPNNSVFCQAQAGNTVYMGGTFTAFTYNTTYGVPLNAATGYPKPTAANYPNGVVYTCVADGSGGWYIGGQFTAVGGQTRNRLARINADGSLHPWNPNANNEVYALAVSGSTVYLGGLFGQIGGQNRSSAAAVDATTGALKAWNPTPNGSVASLEVSGSTVYMGGYFTKMKGVTRNRLAAVDTTSASSLGNWNPNVADGAVGTILVSSGTAYVSGGFTSVGAIARNGLAAIEIAGAGALKAWNPSPNGGAGKMKISGSTIYIAGGYTSIGGAARNRLAGIDTGSGVATSFDPNFDSDVIGIELVGNTLYAGGAFTTAGGASRSKGAAFDITGTGTLKDWSPGIANNNIYNLTASGGYIYAGGNFTSTSLSRSSLAAMDVTTGELTSWNPAANALVHTIQVSGDKVYIGGQFTTVNGTTRNRGAALSATGTGILTPWNPNVTGATGAVVSSIAVNGDAVYMGGYYNAVGGTGRNYLSAVDTATGTLKSWNPNANNEVYTVAAAGSTIYAGGTFSALGGVSRSGLAAIDTAGAGAVKAWNPSPSGYVGIIALSGATTYIGGSFTTIGGVVRNRLAAIDTTGIGTLKAWNPNADNSISWIAVNGTTAYLSGFFGTIGGTSRNRLAAVDTINGTLKTWNPSPDAHVRNLLASGADVYVAGDYAAINSNTTRSRFVVVTDSVTLTACTPALASAITPSCSVSNNNGAVNITVTGGYAPYTYSWAGPNGFTSVTEDINGLATGSYYVTVTSAGGCTASATVSVGVLQPVLPVASILAPAKICYLSQSVFTATGTNLGTAPTYTWYRNGVQIADTTTMQYITSNISKYAPEVISVTIGNINGCVTATSVSASDTVQALNPLDPNTTYTTASGSTKLCEGDTATFTSKSASAIGATFSWAIDSVTVSGANTSSFTTAQAGIITATVTSAEGCVRSATRTINTLPVAIATVQGSTVFCPGDSVTLEAMPVSGASYRWKQDATSRGIAITQVAKTAGSYTVTVTKNSCVATSSPITVSPRVTNTVVTPTTATTVCAPDVVTLQATQDAGYTYQWYRSSTPVSGATASSFSATASGSYKVALSNNGCASKTSLSITATINTAPSAVITRIVNGYAYNTLRAAGSGTGVTYQWYKSDTAINGATARDYVATTSGSYKVLVTKSDCSEYSAAAFEVMLGNGARFEQAIMETSAISVYPNPSGGIFNIGSENPVNIMVKDALGRTVVSQANASEVDLSAQPAGMYMLLIKDARGKMIKTEKLMKN